MASAAPKSGVLAFVVDDEPDILKLVGLLLERFGWTVETFPGGYECMDRVLHAPAPDVIILDVMMPRMDGWETCRKLRARPNLRDTPIVFLTAKGSKEDRERGRLSGADLYLEKGADIGEKLTKVCELLERRGIG
jgi:CheY-like chemotaxis protein